MGRFVLWCPENGQDEEDGKKISAASAETAVKEWAEWYDAHSAEYHIVGGQPATVKLRDLDSNTVTEWIVFGESVPYYRARLKVTPMSEPPNAGIAMTALRPLEPER